MSKKLLTFGLLIAGLVPAMAQDDSVGKLPAVAHKPIAHAAHIRAAAIQAPFPPPRPAQAPAAQPATQPDAPSGKLTQAAAQQNPAQVLQAFTLADLQAALADAQAQTPPDIVAANCYQQLITVVQSPAVNPLPSQVGAFSLFQKGRDLKNIVTALQATNGPLTQLNIACAPLVIDVQQTLIQLGIIGGAVAGTLVP